MNLNKKVKTIVITYEDEECVRLSGKEALKFQETISKFLHAYTMAAFDSNLPGFSPIDMEKDFNYEIIRYSMNDNRMR